MNRIEGVREILLNIRQYLCNTEFAPLPFTRPVDAQVFPSGFAKDICSLFEPRPGSEEYMGEGTTGYRDGYIDYKTLPLEELAKWIAIDHGETRLQASKYMEEARELADYLYLIGYRIKPDESLLLSDEAMYGGFYLCGNCQRPVKNGEKCHNCKPYKEVVANSGDATKDRHAHVLAEISKVGELVKHYKKGE